MNNNACERTGINTNYLEPSIIINYVDSLTKKKNKNKIKV